MNDEIKKWEYSDPLEKMEAAKQRSTQVEMELAEAQLELEKAENDLKEAQEINRIATSKKEPDKFSPEELGQLENRAAENRRIVALYQELKTRIEGTIEQYQGIDEKLQALMKYAKPDEMN